MVPQVVRRIAAGGLLVFGAAFMLFAVGYAMEDPGGWSGAAISAAWVVPIGLLTWLTWTRPAVGGRVAVVLVVLAGVGWVALPFAWETLRDLFDRVGPVFALATIAAAVVTAALGMHRPWLAGWLLVGLAVVNFAGLAAEAAVRGDGPGPRVLLGTSGGVLVVPMLVAGALLVVADRLEHHPVGQPGRPAHA